jgi:hypothetical protein
MDEIIRFLAEDVQGLVYAHDWLGTGTDYGLAEEQQRKFQAKLDEAVRLARELKSQS